MLSLVNYPNINYPGAEEVTRHVAHGGSVHYYCRLHKQYLQIAKNNISYLIMDGVEYVACGECLTEAIDGSTLDIDEVVEKDPETETEIIDMTRLPMGGIEIGDMSIYDDEEQEDGLAQWQGL